VINRTVLKGSESVLVRRSLRNYKSRLQERIQSEFKSPPRYKVIDISGPDHDRVFQVSVTFNGEVLGTGKGRNKKTAEQQAAQLALQKMDENLEQSPDSDH
jgi:ribonuclease-3